MNTTTSFSQPQGMKAVNAASHNMPDNCTLDNTVYGNEFEMAGEDHGQLEQLRRVVVNELCALRSELNLLKKDGWKVAIGPFLQQTPSNSSDEERLHEELDLRTKLSKALVLPRSKPLGLHNSCNSKENEGSDTAATSAAVLEDRGGPWKPSYIRHLKPQALSHFRNTSTMTTFSWDFLLRIFHGAIEHSPGLWYIPSHAGGALISGRTFYAINKVNEPYMPCAPCEHGAKLTAFYNENSPADGGETASKNVPLFMSASPWMEHSRPNHYVYFGNYSQSRWSDRLSYDDMCNHVPQRVKMFWAAQLADPARPAWVTLALMKHFFPMPAYDGTMPSSTSSSSTVTEDDERTVHKMEKAVKAYVHDLRSWEKDAKSMVGLMKSDDLLKAFEQADADESPGLRLWWEYLECVGWDHGFYDMLVKEQSKFIHATR